MGRRNEIEHGPFAKIFAVIGLFAGGIFGLESDGGAGMLFGAVILAAIGGWIGRLADAVVAWLIFIVVSMIFILVNTAIRSFVWQLIASIASGS
ncbi:MAG: hypothetical protein IPL32_03430 [Chloracidobacterium sp.]|nr:hypothetical protein [Chloracidobacterium sp.]